MLRNPGQCRPAEPVEAFLPAGEAGRPGAAATSPRDALGTRDLLAGGPPPYLSCGGRTYSAPRIHAVRSGSVRLILWDGDQPTTWRLLTSMAGDACPCIQLSAGPNCRKCAQLLSRSVCSLQSISKRVSGAAAFQARSLERAQGCRARVAHCTTTVVLHGKWFGGATGAERGRPGRPQGSRVSPAVSRSPRRYWQASR